MYQIEEGQLNTLTYIVNNLTVTGPVQGGFLRSAADILEQVRTQEQEQKTRKRWENPDKTKKDGEEE